MHQNDPILSRRTNTFFPQYDQQTNLNVEDHVLFLKTRREPAASATTFLLAVVLFLFNAVFAALAALATPLRAAPGLFCSLPAVLVAVAAAPRPPRFGLITVVLLDTVDTSVVALWVLVWLNVRCGDDGGAGRGGGNIWPFVVVVVVAVAASCFSFDAVRASRDAWPWPRLACSIIPCTEAEMAEVAAFAAVLSGDVGFSGDTGRAIMLLAGDEGAAAGSG